MILSELLWQINSTTGSSLWTYFFILFQLHFTTRDKKIFEEALKLTGANPDECFYVGDNYYDDYIGSQKVSMPCAIINYQGKLGIEEVDCPIVIEQACEVVDLMKKHLISK